MYKKKYYKNNENGTHRDLSFDQLLKTPIQKENYL